MNLLHLESSPYLLQHANNPIYWNAWNSQTLAKAKENQQLIIVSIGYSACHWCHVMENESFEDFEVAEVMNQYFINIKVDREERPDVDAVYMKAIQIMTGRGGWPLNVVCLPDGRPVWGGTYFRKEEWIKTLAQLQSIYENDYSKMVEYADKLQQGIASLALIDTPETTDLSQDILDPLIEKWKKSFDWEFGGMARAPKFMMPNNYAFLMRYGFQNNDQKLLEFVDLTLTKMAYGGLFDTLDGGFSRYSVDLKWHVPHFEKMAYDNGQLLSLYADAYRLTKNELYREVIEKTIQFIEKEWLTTEGSFYSALDADSLTAENHLEEGAFYVWTKTELQSILKEDFDWFSELFNINDFGFWEHDNYVLIQKESLSEVVNKLNCSEKELQIKKKHWEKLLYDVRSKRNKPRLDDKCLTSWNALIIKGLTDAYKALNDEHYLDLALQNADFICKKLWSPEGNLWRNYKNGTTSINGYLEDYALTIQAFINLYEVTLDETLLQHSKQLTDYVFDYFLDATKGFFRFTSRLDDALIAEHFELEDNVIPASNSVMSDNLFRLSRYYNNSYYERTVEKMLQKIIPSIDYPSAFSNWMNVFMNFDATQKEVGVCSQDAVLNIKKINEEYRPNLIIAGTNSESQIPLLKERFIDNKSLFYVCENKICQLPISDLDTLIQVIT